MGLILFGSILIFFYIAKLFFPQFIVGVAELPGIVKFGKFVDTHIWAYHIYNIVIGFFSAYIYCCGCCRKRKFNWKESLILFGFVILLRLISIFKPEQYTSMNYVIMCISPFILCWYNKSISSKMFISTIMCFSVDIVSQILSIEIRNLIPLSTNLNIATITILLIDGWIWRTLLYLFFNDKSLNERKEENGN